MCTALPTKVLFGWILAAESWAGSLARGTLASLLAVAIFAIVTWGLSVEKRLTELSSIADKMDDIQETVQEIEARQEAEEQLEKNQRREALSKFLRSQQENEK